MNIRTIRSKLFLFSLVAAITAGSFFERGQHMSTFRMAIDFHRSLRSLDPSRIDVLSEAVLLRNLYSSLFEYDLDGNIVTGLAERFHWDHGNLHISLRKGALLSNGNPLSVNDVYFTLMRLMVLNENRHGDLKNILCPGSKIDSVHGGCRGLSIDGDEIVLTPASSTLAHHLIPLLATVDYRVIPLVAMDIENPSIPIKRFDITSGPYSAEEFDDLGNATLLANKYHYVYSDEMPQKVEVLAISKADAVDRFAAGTIDSLPTSFPLTSDDVRRLQSEVKELSIAKSLNIKIRVVFFGRSALKDFSSSNRFALAKFVESHIQKFQSPFETPTTEFFQDLASGYLTTDQRRQVQSARESGSMKGMARKAVVGTTENGVKFWQPIVSGSDSLEAKAFSSHPVELPLAMKPDIYIGTNDVAFNRSSSVIAYNLSNGFFGIYGQEANHWLSRYLSTEDQEEITSQLNSLHFSALMNCAFYPIGAAPYVLLTRNSWRAAINPYFSSTELWLIRRS